MAKKQVVDKEELIEGLKDEERGLISRNDAFSRQNRELEKKNAALQKKIPLIIEEVKVETQKLNAVKIKARNVDNEISTSLSALNKEKRGIDDAYKALDVAQDTLRSGEEALARGNASLSKGKASIGQKNADLAAKIKGHSEATEELRDAINRVSVEKNALVKEDDRKKETIAALDNERASVGQALADAKDVKEQYIAKKCEVSDEKQAIGLLRSGLNTAQKELDSLIGDAKRAQKDIDAKQANLDALLKSHNNALKAFKIREQEHETRELRVTKLIRDKKVGADLAKLKKELKK